MQELTYVDEHVTRTDAPAEVVWGALLSVLTRQGSLSGSVAHLLGCDPRTGTPTFGGLPGDAVPGFRVVEAEPARRLALRGRHRFADYALTFVLEDARIIAQTHADFPGVLGRLYRAAVIGTGGHRIAVRQLLRQVARASRVRAATHLAPH